MANKNTGAYERFQEGMATFVPAGMGFLAGIAIEGPKWLADVAQEKLKQASSQSTHEIADSTLGGEVIEMPVVQHLGSSVLERQEAA
jgi:hypothetical protein